MNDNLYLMWLSRINGVGLKKQNILLNFFKSAKGVFYASPKALKSVYGINEWTCNKILSAQKEDLLEVYQKQLERSNCRFISKFDEKYPCLLKEIEGPPLGIYVAGDLPDDDMVMISIIGCRECTQYGTTMAYRLSYELASCGVIIVSGMARGIDTEAHKGALRANGKTIAVLACGIDIAYPPENWKLIEEVKGNGCVISEHPPGTIAKPGFFPIRNRIISGLSRATIVVEAGERSGTTLTADHALEQGREVMAVPGNVTSRMSVGTNELIKQGAAPITSYKDVLDNLGLILVENNTNETKHNIYHSLAPEEKLIYDCIDSKPLTIDEIINKVKSTASTVNYIITILEMKQCIKKLPGQRYVRS